MAWSFEQVWTGIFDSNDENGVPYPVGSWGWKLANEIGEIAAGIFGVLLIQQGDLDWLSDWYKWPRRNAGSPCGFCPCTGVDGAMPWSNFATVVGGEAPWLNFIFSIAHFLAHVPVQHPMLALSACSGLSAHLDYMHVKHFGVDKYLLGSVLYMC